MEETMQHQKPRSRSTGKHFTRLFACLFLALSCLVSVAQTITGSATGTVTDSTGAVVTGAAITVLNTSTGVTFATVTNKDGIYVVRFLPVGPYTVKVEASGFAAKTIGPFTLEVAQEARINATLGAEMLNTNVVVNTAPPILQAESSSSGDTITGATATEIPLQARNFASLATLAAGAISVTPKSQNSVARSGSGGGFYVNGNREQSNNYTLDGADINEAIDDYIGYSPNVDALDQVRIITGDATAEYGNANGGQVVMVTKSGANKFHGNAFEFLENTALNANSWVNKHTIPISPTPQLDRSQFGEPWGPYFAQQTVFLCRLPRITSAHYNCRFAECSECCHASRIRPCQREDLDDPQPGGSVFTGTPRNLPPSKCNWNWKIWVNQ